MQLNYTILQEKHDFLVNKVQHLKNENANLKKENQEKVQYLKNENESLKNENKEIIKEKNILEGILILNIKKKKAKRSFFILHNIFKIFFFISEKLREFNNDELAEGKIKILTEKNFKIKMEKDKIEGKMFLFF